MIRWGALPRALPLGWYEKTPLASVAWQRPVGVLLLSQSEPTQYGG